MIPFNFRIEILAIHTLLCALGTKGLTPTVHTIVDCMITLYDPAHIFKNIYYALLNHKLLKIPELSCPKNPRELRIELNHLIILLSWPMQAYR